ncbi:MAG TPA: SusE domain-containing protein, partial [Dinghuibacter sp.]|uniref:SusE domain-containing protein n=1 Tax=Dinghuibacter sp. TaxID=2024697 RepID=UPI002C5375FA
TKMTNPTYKAGTAPTLTASATSVAKTPSDSLSTALIFGWTDPKYPAPFPGPAAFTIQIDSAGHNFVAPVILQATPGMLGDTLTSKQINDVVLGMGGSFNTPYSIEVRVISSYANNNDPLTSNVLTIQVTPYKTPPKVQPPTSGKLYIVGSATAGGWSNPVDTVYQQFTQKDSVTYTGNFYLGAGGAYDLLPVNGDWSTKYNVAASGDFSKGGAFQYVSSGGSDIPAPATSGVYTITVNFQTGIFTLTPSQLYDNLWVPGDYQSWTPSSAPMMAAVKQDGSYEGYVNITTTGGFKLTNEADWNGTAYGDTAAAGMSGVMSTSGQNMNIPSTGWYWLQANTKTLTWSATKITQWGLIGDFNSWNADVVMTYSSTNNNWTGTITAASAGGFKVRANAAWTLSLGTGGPGGSMTSNGGGNIPVTAGTHTVTMSLAAAGYYTIIVQ